VFDANVYAANGDAAGYATEIRRRRPDVVVLQEPSPAFLARLEATGALGDLPHRITVSRSDPFAAEVASRWELTEHDVVASAQGRPYQMTWPRNRRIVPPLARIDHVLTTRGLAVTRIAAGVGRGSDHRPLIADVAVVGTAAGGVRSGGQRTPRWARTSASSGSASGP